MLPIALLIAIAVAPTAADGAGLRLTRLARTSELPVASGGSGELAYLLSPTALRVRGPGRSARVYGVRVGCRPVGIASGVVALGCAGPTSDGEDATQLAVLRERDGAVVAVRHPPGRFFGGLEVFGTRWMIVDGSAAGDDPRVARRYLVEWSTGRTVEIAGYLGGGGDPFGLDEYADLDAVQPIRRLCAPLTRSDSLSPVTRIGRWIALLGPQGWYCAAAQRHRRVARAAGRGRCWDARRSDTVSRDGESSTRTCARMRA